MRPLLLSVVCLIAVGCNAGGGPDAPEVSGKDLKADNAKMMGGKGPGVPSDKGPAAASGK